jgi:Mg/Co/Ni transporter MgtE
MIYSYHILALAVLSVAGYVSSAYLVKRGLIRLTAHRYLWNYLLLASFLLSGILGLVLAIFIDYKISISWYRGFLWLHVESGIIMAVISFFHIGWHWRYFWRRPRSIT